MFKAMDCKYMVFVRCFTYNHSAFIKDAMDGFCKQQTSFPFVCAIVDDASTDGEQYVINQYLNDNFDLEDKSVSFTEETNDYILIFSRNKFNKHCYFIVLFLKYNHHSLRKAKFPYYKEWYDRSKYIAICEGDDFWTDSKKLHKQIEFLENNEDYIVCSHDFIIFEQEEKCYHNTTYYNSVFNNLPNDSSFFSYDLDNYFDGWWTQPLSCIYRNGDYLKMIPRNKYKRFRDDVFFYYVLKEGKGALLRDNMGVYRHNNTGVWSTVGYLEQRSLLIYNAYNIFLVENDRRAYKKIIRHQIQRLLTLKESGNRKQFWKDLKYYIGIDPFHYKMKLIWSIIRFDIGKIHFKLIKSFGK